MTESTNNSKMTNEQGREVLDLTNRLAWRMKYKAPHLTQDELQGEFTLTCMKIFKKYGFEINLMKRACHAKMVDLVRFNVNHPTLNMEFDEALDSMIHEGKSSVDNPTLDTCYASGSRSIEKDAADGTVMSELLNYLHEVFDEAESLERKYLDIVMELSGSVNLSGNFDIKSLSEERTENAIAQYLGYPSGSATSFRYLRGKIRLTCAFFLCYKGYKTDIPSSEWTDESAYKWMKVGRSLKTLEKCKEVLGLDENFELSMSDVVIGL